MFAKPKKVIGLDIGSHSVKAVQMSRSGGRLYVDEAGFALVDRSQANVDPVLAHSMAVRDAILSMPVAQCMVVGALAGQTAVIRYPRLVDTPPEQMDLAVQREAGQNIPYDLAEVFLDWTLLSEVDEGDHRQIKILLVAAKHEVIDARLQILNAADVQPTVLGVDSLALADAAEACGFLNMGETVALINIGLSSASIHFVKDGVSNFIRDVSWGARELIQAIAKDRRVDFEEAERLLLQVGQEQQDAPPPPPVAPVYKNLDDVPTALPVNDDPFGEPLSGIGTGGSLLDPLEDEMGLGALAAPQGKRGPVGTVQPDLRDVLTAPMNRMVSEIRRSFDYYEHQLYERPVDRIILSGGVSHLPLLRATLLEELGLEHVEVADPSNSALFMGDEGGIRELRVQPSSFMVAIGLAARGMAEL